MASVYFLLCVDCRQYLSLGKLYWLTESGESLGELTLDGVYDPAEKAWCKRDKLFGRSLEGFLIRHRNHELRFVPEGVDELLETREQPIEPVDPEEIVAPTEIEDLNPEEEVRSWKRKLAR